MSAAKPQVQKSVEPQRAIRNRNVGQPLEVQDDDGQDKSGPGPPPRAKAAAPASTHTSDDASLLPSELTNAAREARASRKRALIGLLVLIIAAAGALAAGLAVKQAVFWGASASVFAAASMALVAYGAEKLGVFGQTAELLSRRAASDDATKSRSSTRGRDDPQDETKLQRQVAGDIAWDILCLPRGTQERCSTSWRQFREISSLPRLAPSIGPPSWAMARPVCSVRRSHHICTGRTASKSGTYSCKHLPVEARWRPIPSGCVRATYHHENSVRHCSPGLVWA